MIRRLFFVVAAALATTYPVSADIREAVLGNVHRAVGTSAALYAFSNFLGKEQGEEIEADLDALFGTEGFCKMEWNVNGHIVRAPEALLAIYNVKNGPEKARRYKVFAEKVQVPLEVVTEAVALLANKRLLAKKRMVKGVLSVLAAGSMLIAEFGDVDRRCHHYTPTLVFSGLAVVLPIGIYQLFLCSLKKPVPDEFWS